MDGDNVGQCWRGKYEKNTNKSMEVAKDFPPKHEIIMSVFQPIKGENFRVKNGQEK